MNRIVERSVVYWHSEGAVLSPNGAALCVRSANLIDFFLALAPLSGGLTVVAPRVDPAGGPQLVRPAACHFVQMPLRVNNMAHLIREVLRLPLFMVTTGVRRLLRETHISVSVGLSGLGTLAGLARVLLGRQPHCFVVRGNRLETLRGSGRGSLSRGLAMARVWTYGRIMRSLVRAGRAEVWFQGQEHHELFKSGMPDGAHQRIKLLNAVLRELPAAPEDVARDVDLVFLGRVSLEKGIRELVDSLRLLRDRGRRVTLRVVGRGPGEAQMKERAAAAGVSGQIDFAGFAASTDQVARALAAARLFVLPSYTEGLPRSLLESMHLGTPTLCSAVGGVPYIITHGRNGFLVEPRRPELLADRIAETLDRVADRSLGDLIGAARETAAAHTFAVRGEYFLRHAGEGCRAA